MRLAKVVKWGASSIRVAIYKVCLGVRVSWPKGGKPVYLGRGARIRTAAGSHINLGPGVYLSESTLLQTEPGSELRIGANVFLNANARIVAAESVFVGEHTLIGPNVCVYDHDHVFDADGVHGELTTAPVHIGKRCWLGANTLVTKGCELGDAILVGGGSVVTGSLRGPGVYAGVPARLIKSHAVREGGVSDEDNRKTIPSHVGDRKAQVPRECGGAAFARQAAR